jgi:hypothetical protein
MFKYSKLHKIPSNERLQTYGHTQRQFSQISLPKRTSKAHSIIFPIFFILFLQILDSYCLIPISHNAVFYIRNIEAWKTNNPLI